MLERPAVSHRDIILLCSRLHFKWISLCYCAPLGAKIILSRSHFVRQLLPLYFLIRFFDPDQPYTCTISACHFDMNKLLRNLTRSDNTSCYYSWYKRSSLFGTFMSHSVKRSITLAPQEKRGKESFKREKAKKQKQSKTNLRLGRRRE
jgi:hypothetical protein